MTDTSDFEKMEQDGWADPAIAKGYATAFDTAARVVAERLADAVQAGRQTRALDLCSGHGVVAATLVARGATVTGLDFSAPMIALAQAAVPKASFVQGDAMAMEFADHSFDVVTIGFGVPHFPDPARGLAEAARVLKPGGTIAFSIWHGKGSAGSFGWLFDAVGRLGDPSVTLPAGPDAHILVDRAIAEPMVHNAGFADMQISEVASELWLRAPEDLFDTFDQGAVRAASLLSGQSAARRDAIRADLAAKVRAKGTAHNGGYLVPAPSVVISATRR
ncbi:MAG: methyltransferase domain-containing protein [Sulfitobacter sp.]